MKKRFIGLVAALVVVFGGAFALVPTQKASAEPIPAAFTCQYASDHYIQPGGQLLYAAYDYYNGTYHRAYCWEYYSGNGGLYCTYWARYYDATGSIGAPYNQTCQQ